MAFLDINASTLGEGLSGLLLADDIVPGNGPSYEICKAIYAFHPLGEKLASVPIKLAQSKPREISIPNAPEERVRRQFLDQWRTDNCDKHLLNLHRLKRIYGIASLALLTKGKKPSDPIDYDTLWKDTISFNVLDPLNTAGSLVGDLDPNSMSFLKTAGISVNGIPYHRSRSVVVLNEEPIYLEWTTSAFGYVGRSVYQRTLFPLKSFIQTMITDDLVAKKAGVLVAALKQPGSIIDNIMQTLFARKREVVQEAATGNVISIGTEERIESLNLQNINGAMKESRKNILDNIASGAGMPAILITSETFSSDFHEGTEDAKAVADYIKHEQDDMLVSYAWMDKIIQHRAWNPEFYQTIQNDFPKEYGKVDYKTAFYQWRNSFSAIWPSLLTEPESEKVRVDEVRLKALIASLQVLLPELDQANKTATIQWAADNLNQNERLFTSPLDLDYEALAEYVPPAASAELSEPKPGHPFAMQDSDYGAAAYLRERKGTSVDDLAAQIRAEITAALKPNGRMQ